MKNNIVFSELKCSMLGGGYRIHKQRGEGGRVGVGLICGQGFNNICIQYSYVRI